MGDAPPSDKYIYIFIRIREEITLLEQKRVPGLDSPARQLRGCFSNTGTSRRSAGGRGAARRGSPASPGPRRPPAPEKPPQGKAAAPAPAGFCGKDFPSPPRPRKESTGVVVGKGHSPIAASGHSSPAPQALRTTFFFNCDLLPYTRNLLIERLFFFLSIFKDPFFEG